MTANKLKKPISAETAFSEYVLDELIGEGGAGRVFGGKTAEQVAVAVKVLTATTSDKRRRFKNEIGFLSRNRHGNVVSVIDHGVVRSADVQGPFYVMRRFDGNLRDLMRAEIPPPKVLSYFNQILDGVEAAHLQGVVHRDLKPENILYDAQANILAIADFGIASFTEDQLVTLVETSPAQRLANFQYAAPEQRAAGQRVSVPADIYALGMILNEMFTKTVPHGTSYRKIADLFSDYAYLDRLVDEMLRQKPTDRPGSIADVKGLLQRYATESIALQRLSKIDGTVIKVGEIDEPLAHEPPRLVGVDWDQGQLKLTLDRPVTSEWIRALNNMGSHTAVMGVGPERFTFRGTEAVVQARDHDVQQIINYFKDWLPKATQMLRSQLTAAAAKQEAEQKQRLAREREAEEKRLRILSNIKL
jgi:serine/threonine protein kinase